MDKKIQVKLRKPRFFNRVAFTLVKKELSNYFSTPLAYIIFILFIVIVAIIFFGVFRFTQSGTADLSLLFSD